MAIWIGTPENDTHNGGEQEQFGIGGDDYLAPFDNDKSYFLYGGDGDDQLLSFEFNDELYGEAGNDLLKGYNGKDYLDGGPGADILDGEYNKDKMVGGDGPDTFVFDTTVNRKKNYDKILDFESGTDVMHISKTYAFGIGKVDSFLKPGKFEVGKDATSDKTRILYNEKKGVVFFTPKGDEAGKLHFVKVTKGMDLDPHDFFIIA